MANFLLQAGGTLDGSFPWSINAVASSTGSEAAVAAAWSTAWEEIFADAALKAYIPAMTELTETSCSTADATFHQTTKTVTSTSLSGTAATVALPFRTASIVTLRTSQETRWGRGRWYLPGPNTTALSAAGYFFLPAYTAALAGALTPAMTTFAATAQLQILHRKATAHGPGALTLTPVTIGDVSDQPASQRRRADKRLPIRTAWTL
jgi:hypothetical protein